MSKKSSWQVHRVVLKDGKTKNLKEVFFERITRSSDIYLRQRQLLVICYCVPFGSFISLIFDVLRCNRKVVQDLPRISCRGYRNSFICNLSFRRVYKFDKSVPRTRKFSNKPIRLKRIGFSFLFFSKKITYQLGRGRRNV